MTAKKNTKTTMAPTAKGTKQTPLAKKTKAESGKLSAIDLQTQKPAWVFQTEASRKNVAALSMPDGSLNFAVAFSENFYDDMVTGVAKIYTVGSILSSPVVVDNVVLFGSTDGYLYALI